MNSKQLLNELALEALAGNFGKVYTKVITEKPSFENNSAIKIVVAACNVCHKNISDPEKLNHEDLCKLMRSLLGYFHNPQAEIFGSYVQSVFHIVKFLLAKNKLTCIMQLKPFIIPEFLPFSLTDKHKSVYKSIAKTLYNSMGKATQSKDQNKKSEYVEIIYLMADIYKVLNDKSDFIDSAHNSLIGLMLLKVSNDDLLKLYVYIFNLIGPIDDSLYTSIINTFSLLYTQFIKNEDFQTAKKSFQYTIQHKELSKNKEFGCLSEIMAIVDWLNPIDNLEPKTAPERAHSALKYYHRTYKITKNLQSVCDLISSVSCTVAQVYKKSKLWCEKIEVHTNFYKFLNDVSLIMAKTPKKCSDCSTEVNLNEALRVLSSLGTLARNCLTNGEVSRIYKVELIRYLDKHLEYVRKLKEAGCEKWKKFWYDVGANLYNIGTLLFRKKDYEMCFSYLQKFVRNYLEIETEDNHIVEKTFLSSSFSVIAESYFENQDFEKCLLFSSVAVVVSGDNKSPINVWIRAKAASREKTIEEDDLQQLTLVSILEKSESELCKLFPERINLSDARKIELLIYELNQYNAKWKSKIPMASVYKEIAKLATPHLCSELFIEIWANSELQVHDSLTKCLDEIINKLEVEQSNKKNLFLAHLYYSKHKYRLRTVISKHCDDMEKTINIPKVTNEAVPPDPDDECDLVSSYDCLKLRRYMKMTHDLNQSLDLAAKWVKDNKKYDEKLFKLLANLGHEFSLHCHVVRSLEAWYLALTVARSLKNTLYIIQAISFIIEQSDSSKSLIKNLIQDGDSCIQFLIDNKNHEDLLVYYFCKAQTLIYEDFTEAYNCYCKSLEIFEKGKFNGNITGRMYLMKHKFRMLPCKFGVDHKNDTLVPIYQATSTINDYYSITTPLTAYDMRVFFEIYQNTVQMYHNLRLPRETRCYAKDAVLFAQKMVLPLRVTELLYYLAYSDVRTSRLDDCRVKVKDFSDILGNGKVTTKTPSPLKMKETRDQVDIIIENIQELVLDVPQANRLSGSPIFVKDKFKFPAFLNHDEDCNCWYCTCIEYQQHVLRQTYLSGLLNEHQKDFAQAQDFFFGCFQIYKCLVAKSDSYVKKHFKTLPLDLIPNPKETFMEIHLITLFEYCYFMVRNGRHEEAESINLKNLQLIESKEKYTLKLIHVYNEILMQTLNILVRKEESEESQQHLPVVPTESLERTPPNRQSEVLAMPTLPIAEHDIKSKILPKVIKFNLSEDEEDAKEHSSLPPPRTPAPSTSRVKIHVDKPRKRKEKITSDIIAIDTSEDEACNLNQAFLTPCDKVDRKLAARTKMLTEKLRSSNRKVKEGVGDSKEELKDVRQNLMNKLGPDERSGAVRRSARNKK